MRKPALSCNRLAKPKASATRNVRLGPAVAYVYRDSQNTLCKLVTGLALMGLCTLASADPDPAAEWRNAQERLSKEREAHQKPVDVMLGSPPKPEKTLPANEKPCFTIHQATVKVMAVAGKNRDRDFAWLDAELNEVIAGDRQDDSPYHRCLGILGINILVDRLQNRLVEKGYVTSRILISQQNIAEGVLQFTLIPGVIDAIKVTGDGGQHSSLRTAMPMQAGDVLNLRDIEQSLENLKRATSVDANFTIEPAANIEPGLSTLVINLKETSHRYRLTLSADNSGTQSSGKNQGSLSVSVDNPLGLNDIFYVTANQNLSKLSDASKGTRGGIIHYSMPFGYSLVELTASNSSYFQTIVGAFQDYVYSGTSSRIDATLTLLAFRDATSKTSLSVGGFQRKSRNYIDDTEVEIQRRNVAGWELGLMHRRFFGSAKLDARLRYKKGTGAFGAIAAPEERFGEGSARFALTTLDWTLDWPFKLANNPFTYGLSCNFQQNHTPLTVQERFAIGGRASVRGFDGETSLAAERGFYCRNTVATPIAGTAQEAYLGLDYGEVGGDSARNLAGKRLAGTALGWRGGWQSLRYDGFVATPIRKPERLHTRPYSLAFNLFWSI